MRLLIIPYFNNLDRYNRSFQLILPICRCYRSPERYYLISPATADEAINSPLIKKEFSLRVKETQPIEETWQYLNKERKSEIFYFVLNCSNLREI